MILAASPPPAKTDPIATLPHDLRDFARQAACNGTPLDTSERGLLKRLLSMGQTTTHLFLEDHGHGDPGSAVKTAKGTVPHRSEEPQKRSILAIFGQDCLRAFGYPIATGVIEGACRHVIKDRMEQGGMRWTQEGAVAMLNLRAVNASDAAEEFGQWRQDTEAIRVHPNRPLVDAYAGFNA